MRPKLLPLLPLLELSMPRLTTSNTSNPPVVVQLLL
jgi:hypothetical protein